MKARRLIVLIACLTWLGASEPMDPRSKVLLRRDCLGETGHSDVTLFGNGTIRLREGEEPAETMRLAELPLDVLRTYVNRLEEIDLSETDAGVPESELKWIGRCEIEVGSGEGESRVFQFGHFDSLSLALARVNTIASELVVEAEERVPKGHLPRDYEPRAGDVLVRADGAWFKVIAYTSDKKGIELQGVEQPLIIYVPVDDMDEWFTELISRQDFF
ncbi:MAG: hypothetical protein WBG93_01725 [Thermoanaerobaculia bacterium]